MATSVVHDNDYVPPVAKPPTKIVTSESQALTIISCVIGVFTLGVAAWVYQHIQKKKLKDPVEIETDFGNPQGTARAVDFADVDFDFGGDVAQEAPAAAAVSRNDFEFDFGSNPVNSAGGGAGGRGSVMLGDLTKHQPARPQMRSPGGKSLRALAFSFCLPIVVANPILPLSLSLR